MNDKIKKKHLKSEKRVVILVSKKKKMKYVYGPVPSRRLGRSLGIDLIPSKTCNYQCVYCQLGKTTCFTNIRKNYFPKNDILSEIKNMIKKNKNNFDYVTFVGSGEPTLYKDIGEIILKTKEFTNKPICIVTNGSLLYNKEVKNNLMHADAILPSLDAGDENLFKKINRPHPSLNFKSIIQGFIDFKQEFKGKFWIEVMLMKGINDSDENITNIKKIIDLIQPDRIDINIPIRPPAENWVKIPGEYLISRLNKIFNKYNNIFYPERGIFKIYSSNFENNLLSIIERHPMRLDQIIETFCTKNTTNEILKRLEFLKSKNKIETHKYNEQIYWKLKID